MLAPGQIVDRYEVLAVLGEGGMATVYRVRHQRLGSQHALKVLHVPSNAIAERLLAEGRVQAGLDHPNALTVTDVIDVDGAPGLVMELVEGGTLLDWIEGDPPREERLRVFREVCEAVASAHERGWIHRDLKPINVMMKPVGDRVIPKVADFGLVKAMSTERPRDGGRTRDGVAMGTPGYMAPEQIADAASVDARADVYSLGCILVFVITGQPAFEGEMLDMFSAVIAGQHRALPADDPLYAVVERCLERRPEGRPADARALLALLDAPPPGPPVPAPTTPMATLQDPSAIRSRPSRPSAAPAIGAFAGIGALVVGLSLACLCGVGGLGLWPDDVGSRGPGRLLRANAGTDCPLSDRDVRLGYALVKMGPAALGDVHLLVAPAKVHARAMDDRDAVCTLPAGARVAVKEVPRAKRSEPENRWLAVFANGVTLP
jgi:serine/threonine protein kinase